MALASPVQYDGDMGFVGYASRLNPTNLPSGVLQLSENMRLERGTAQTRKGAKRLAQNITFSDSPLTVPFDLGTSEQDAPVVKSEYGGGIFAATVLRSPDPINSFEVIALAGADRVYLELTDGRIENSVSWGDGPIQGTETGQPNFDILTNEEEAIVTSVLPSQLTFPTGPDESIEVTDKVSMIQAFDRLYVFREADPNIAGWSQQNLSSDGTHSISVSGTTATVNCTSHGYSAGMTVRLEGSSVPAFDGHEYRILGTPDQPTANTFKITVPSGTAQDTLTAGRTVRRVKPPLYWTGDPTTNFVRAEAGIPPSGPTYKRLRSAPWASYINGRLIVPDGRDTVLVSDLYDPDTFDPFWAGLRANFGTNDYLVAVHPWVEGAVLLFFRKSIWLAEINDINVLNGNDSLVSRLSLLTDEIGCRARRSIQTAGQFVYFLSDSGVYRLDARLDLKLRGDTRPLSDPISDQLAEINEEYAWRAAGLWWNNRYYLGAPTGNSDNNNSVFIYSALNDQWETKDTYGFGADSFIVSNWFNERRLFISNQAGGLFLMDEVESGDENADLDVTEPSPVIGRIVTRRFGFNSPQKKRFVRALSDLVLPSGASLSVAASMRNPDEDAQAFSLTNTSGEAEDYAFKMPVRSRAHYAELTFTTQSGRPEIRSATIEAAGPSQPSSDTRNAA
jgi:hypothetical protein